MDWCHLTQRNIPAQGVFSFQIQHDIQDASEAPVQRFALKLTEFGVTAFLAIQCDKTGEVDPGFD
ncbi:hypothetical protein MDMS009_2031 [Methylophaga thiooxydans DMS010]|uniref:Uncharacterized protein n=1 Tax=Methylophaga thiooxydans DMS010 TaxID=637616 RepID=C0N7D6_9GAMM|nr:hypothetical protein MDMS009_2031 [Methylophaga thiooxydans DMS010]